LLSVFTRMYKFIKDRFNSEEEGFFIQWVVQNWIKENFMRKAKEYPIDYYLFFFAEIIP
jgi:hypothetical protein